MIDTGSDWLEDTKKRVRDYDASRPRSQQAEPGWSEVGGCRAYLGYRLAGEWPTDEPDSWAAIRGTAIHKYLEPIFAGADEITEIETTYRGIPGHADLTITQNSVTDWKTTKLVNARLWRDSLDALWEKRVQVHGYAAGLVDAGTLPEDCTVRLCVIPVDGTFADWWAWSERFDRSIADWGADRLESVRELQARGQPLPKDKKYKYCSEWCRFFTVCRGQDDPDAAGEITDPETVAAIAAYGEATEQQTALKKRKEGLDSLIRGLRGTAGEWRISLGRPGEPSWELDEEWIRADYAARGEPVPMVEKPGSAPRLTVTRIRKREAKP